MQTRRRVARAALALLMLPGFWACGAGSGGADDPASDPPLHAEAADGGSVAGPRSGAAGEPGVPGDDGPPLSPGSTDRPMAGASTVETAGPSGAGAGVARRPPPDPVDLPAAGGRPRFTRPEHLRGLYLNAWATGSSARMADFLEIARQTEVNAVVLDMKDATGFVSYASGVPAIRETGALGELRIRDLPGLLRLLEAEGVYPIARIVIVKDPLLVAARPELAIQDTAGGVWVDSKELVWLNLYDRRVWEYHVALAEELARLGFPEIQWDYVRFPDAPASDMARAVFPGDSLGPRAEAVRAFLGYARERLDALDLDVQMTADVFGVTTTFNRDVGIGQLWERFIDRVDAALPMVYPSHYWTGSFGLDKPNSHPYQVVREAMEDAVRRSNAVEGAGRVVPWLQDFTLGPPRYGAPEVRAQIQGAYDAGIREWILWNPGSRYTREALEPVEGFHLEPLLRIGDEIVTMADRFDAVERDRIAQALADSVAAVRARAAQREAATDSTVRRPPSADSVRAPGGGR